MRIQERFYLIQNEDNTWTVEVYDIEDYYVGEVTTIDFKSAILSIQDVVTSEDLNDSVDPSFNKN